MQPLQPRIQPLQDDQAPGTSQAILQQLRRALGMVPNLHRTLAHSPAALDAYVRTAATLAGGQLAAPLREQIAVATAGINRCNYCAAAHTALGQGTGLDAEELSLNLHAKSSDPRVGEALAFVRALIDERGAVTDAQLQAVRTAGFSEAEIVEIVAHVGMNWFTNAFNRLARTRVDFPPLSRDLERPEGRAAE